MKFNLLDVAVSPVDSLLYVIEDNVPFITVLLLFFIVLSSVLFTVFVVKKHKNGSILIVLMVCLYEF